MNDRIIHQGGDVNLTVTLWLQDATTGALKTAATVTSFDYRYIRVEDDNDTTISAATDITALAGLDVDHADGKMYEIGEGAYRFDIPDAAVSAGAKYAAIIVWDAENDTILPTVQEIQLVGYKGADLEKAAKMLINKAIQTKATGAIDYYDDDGETIILTHTPTDEESTITRTPG